MPFHALGLAFAAIVASASPAAAERLSGEGLRQLVTGRTVYLAAPLGGEFPLRYRPDGTVTGDGEAVGLGRFMAARETGNWGIEGDRLCQRFPTWNGGRRVCFTVERIGDRRIRWVQDNGDTGVARVADR